VFVKRSFLDHTYFSDMPVEVGRALQPPGEAHSVSSELLGNMNEVTLCTAVSCPDGLSLSLVVC